MFKKLFQNISPKNFYFFSSKIIPWAFLFSLLFISYGLYLGLFVAPSDYQQGDAFRIIYVHVPSAWLSLFAYTSVFVCSVISLIWKIKVFEILSIASAKNGAIFTFLALITGSIWGKPMWGTWWEWGDPRLTSELLMLFLYLGYMALRASINDTQKADKLSSIFILVGAINVPVIHYSVEWWSSLHQTSTLLKLDGPSIATSMLIPLMATIIGTMLYFISLLLIRVRAEVIYRHRGSKWVRDLILEGNHV